MQREIKFRGQSMNKKTAYVSLPITGRDIEDVEAECRFAEIRIKEKGFIPVSPLVVSCDHDAPYSEHMGKDIAALLECDAVYFLRGWHESKGCNAEFEIAKIYGKEIVFE
jgi:hypothetical protein